MGQWGTLQYTSTSLQQHPIMITSFSQSQELDGETKQSRTGRFFYPRSHMPGDIAIEGICSSQDEYQELALFVRKHQRLMLTVKRISQLQDDDVAKLLTLDIPTEQVRVRGFIKQFGMVKKGVFVPAPTYTFNFLVVLDNTARNIGISNRVKRYYAKGARM